MKLTAKDLRVGNLVITNNPKYRSQDIGKVACIVAINSLKKYEELDGDALIYHLDNEWKDTYGQFLIYLEPIPLTEEWLLRFGFEKKENNWKCLCICNDWTYLYWERLAGLELSVNKHSVMLPHIKYVHQLQNLYFALTNQELEIK